MNLLNRNTLERDVEKELVRLVKSKQGEVRKVKWIGRNGAPDRRVMLGCCAWVELKRPGYYETAAQNREHRRMRSAGETVTVVASLQGALDLVFDLCTNSTIHWRYE